MSESTWTWREQDAHPEIRLEAVSVLQRRVAFAGLRADGHSVRTTAIVLCMNDQAACRYEARRRESAAAYEAMRSSSPGRELGAGS